MAKIVFFVSYEIDPNKREDYLDSIKEYKSLIKSEGLANYSLLEEKGKSNKFREVFEFDSEEAFDEFDDAGNDRLTLLNRKLESFKIAKSTHSRTLVEIEI
jgi:antibiotic biosynthesis monooxygenase (ABM) superfamily enzyme